MRETLAPGTRVRVNDKYDGTRYPTGTIVGPSRTGVYVVVKYDANEQGLEGGHFYPHELDVLESDTYCLLDFEGDWWVSDNLEHGWVLAAYPFPDGGYAGLNLNTVVAMVDERPYGEQTPIYPPDDEAIEVDVVNHPAHYKQYPVEVIEITEHLNFCMGNAVKYLLRADHKGKPVEDLRKARWYIDRELERRGYNDNESE